MIVRLFVHDKLKLKTSLQSWKLCQRHFQGQIVFGSAYVLSCSNCISFANELLGVNSIVLSFAVTCNNCLTNRFPFTSLISHLTQTCFDASNFRNSWKTVLSLFFLSTNKFCAICVFPHLSHQSYICQPLHTFSILSMHNVITKANCVSFCIKSVLNTERVEVYTKNLTLVHTLYQRNVCYCWKSVKSISY